MTSAARASRRRRWNPLPETYCSRQPRAPQGHGRPSATTWVWPSSPAALPAPHQSWPSSTTPEPTPVPTKTASSEPAPRCTPKRYSPQAAARTSFSTVTGTPKAAASVAASGTSRQPRLAAWTTAPVSAWIWPAQATPIEARSFRPSARAATAPRTVSSTAAEPRWGWVRASVCEVSRPSTVTAPARTRVPPRSTPMTEATPSSPRPSEPAWSLPCSPRSRPS